MIKRDTAKREMTKGPTGRWPTGTWPNGKGANWTYPKRPNLKGPGQNGPGQKRPGQEGPGQKGEAGLLGAVVWMPPFGRPHTLTFQLFSYPIDTRYHTTRYHSDSVKYLFSQSKLSNRIVNKNMLCRINNIGKA